MSYIECFISPLSIDELDNYKKRSGDAGKIWMDHGALSFSESVAKFVNPGELSQLKLGANDTAILTYITFNSLEHRDEVITKTLADPRFKEANNLADHYLSEKYDFKGLLYGNFETFVEY